MIVAAYVLYAGMYSLPANNPRDFFVFDDVRTIRYDEFALATTSLSDEDGSGKQPPRSVENTDWTYQVTYECIDCDNLLTKEVLIKIEEAELYILSQPEYENICLARSTTDSDCHELLGFISLPSIIKGLGT